MKKIPDPKTLKRVKGIHVHPSDLTQVKVRITTYLDHDLIDILKKLAQKKDGKYQTLLNEVLRESLTGQHPYGNLVERIDRLEQQVFRKRKVG